MNKSIRKSLAKGKRRVRQRLERARRLLSRGAQVARSRVQYEISDRVSGIAYGGIGLINNLIKKIGLADEINGQLNLLKQHRPYHESDHVLNIVINAFCGGRTLEEIELRRNDEALLDALGLESLPDPTTAGDFCRRFGIEDVESLLEAINRTRVKIWKEQDPAFTSETARIDVDGSIVPTEGECKQGMDISYNGVWGYHPLLVSLANTREALFVVNRSGNRPSHDGCVPWIDRAVALCREGGFTDVLLRGDTDFSITGEFDRWTAEGVRFVFGYDAKKNLIAMADHQPDDTYRELVRRTEETLEGSGRQRPENVKDRIITEREFEVMRPLSEEVTEFDYEPVKCSNAYRVVAVRKTLSHDKGQERLFESIRYLFYITNDRTMSAEQVIQEAHDRCEQENLIEQLKHGVRALHAPTQTLEANWAYMVMTTLAWNLKAWLALSYPVSPRWATEHEQQRERLLTMEFRTFLAAIINIPCQIVRTGRRIVYRVLSWNPWQHVFFRLVDVL